MSPRTRLSPFSTPAAVIVAMAAAMALPGCGGAEKPLTTAEMKSAAATACEGVADDSPFETTAPVLSDDPTELRTQLRDLVLGRRHLEGLHKLDIPDSQRARFDVWLDSAGDVFLAIDSIVLNLELRDLDAASLAVDEGRAAVTLTQESGAALGVPECEGDVWSAGVFDHSADVIAAQQASLAPTGDYAADMKAICGRFANDILSAPTDGDPGVNAALRFSAFRQALDLFARDLARLEPPPALADAHEALVVAVEDLGGTASEAAAAGADSAAAADFDRELAEVTELIGAVNPDC